MKNAEAYFEKLDMINRVADQLARVPREDDYQRTAIMAALKDLNAELNELRG